jgi:hypothetical protein
MELLETERLALERSVNIPKQALPQASRSESRS